MAREKIIGVYKITNLVNGKVYIGSSKNIRKRWINHKNKLNKQIHENSYLQRAWNKYGEDSFQFEILEVLSSEENLIQVEQKYIDSFKAYDDKFGYNLCKLAQCGKPTICSWEEFSQKASSNMMSESQLKEIIRLLCDTNLNFAEISRRVGVGVVSVGDVFHRRTFSNLTKDSVFVTPRYFDSGLHNRKLTEKQAIEIIRLLSETDMPIVDIAQQYGVAYRTVLSIYNKQNWKSFSYDKTFIKRTTKKAILQYSLNLELIAEYDSALAAHKATGFARSSIIDCCNGKKEQASGYIWRYK